MNYFCLKSYDIPTHKVSKPLRLMFISDLHGIKPVRERELYEKIEERNPDLILVGGDLIVSGKMDTWDQGYDFLKTLSQKYPLYIAYGNHEQKLTRDWNRYEMAELAWVKVGYLHTLSECGTILVNESREITVKGEHLVLTGLAPARKYFRKLIPSRLSLKKMKRLVGEEGERECYHILLAHSPYHADTYLKWGCDLTLSGHYHGGVWRFGENRGLISTYFHLFPKYCCGSFEKEGRRMIVSAGLGEHTVRVRIHNPRELVEVCLRPQK